VCNQAVLEGRGLRREARRGWGAAAFWYVFICFRLTVSCEAAALFSFLDLRWLLCFTFLVILRIRAEGRLLHECFLNLSCLLLYQ
jgi:hypothetical protein